MKRTTKVLTLLFCASWLYGISLLVGNFPVNGQDCPIISCPPSLCKLKLKSEDDKFCDQVNCLGAPTNCTWGDYEDKLTMCNCCPGCAVYLNLGEECFPRVIDPEVSWENCIGPICPIKMNKCRPGLECPGGNSPVCSTPPEEKEPDSTVTECNLKRSLFKAKALHWEPKCDTDGNYSPKQCKGKKSDYDGICFCVNKDGGRIFGRERWDKAENQTCACSRMVHKLREEDGNIATIHCTSDGNFEPLQCDMDSGLCYCVDTKTGVTNGAVAPENKWKTLPCYNRTYWGEDGHYLRQCESSWAAWMRLRNEATLHGLDPINAGDSSICDYDGSFAAKQAKDNRDNCVFKNGQQIADYFSQQGVMKNMNCLCARDEVLAKEEGRPFPLTCEKVSGNYANTSIYTVLHNEFTRCIDRDGFFFGQEEIPPNLDCCLLDPKNCKPATIIPQCNNAMPEPIRTCDSYEYHKF